MINVAIVGLGKMGLSHLAIFRAHPQVNIIGICDRTGYLLDLLEKYTALKVYKDYKRMLDETAPDAVVIATPTHLHAEMIQEALERDIHVFCEKPLVLEPSVGGILARMAEDRGLVTQVGYHNRFVSSFQEVRRLLDRGAIGAVTTVLAESYGPVVLKPAGRTWRSKRDTGGGCLYDYAAHPLNLITWYLGTPEYVSGSRLTKIFSTHIDDAVATTLHYPTGTAQIVANWSDESQRKMTTKVTLWGEYGRIYADRQEVHLYLRDSAPVPDGYRVGWNIRYTTDLTEAPGFYLRGEEYSAQVDEFVKRVRSETIGGENDFASASVTDAVIAKIVEDAECEDHRLAVVSAAAQIHNEATVRRGSWRILRRKR